MRMKPPDRRRIEVAVGLAEGRDGGLLLPTFARAWPVERAAPFEELLREIDEAECEFAGVRR